MKLTNRRVSSIRLGRSSVSATAMASLTSWAESTSISPRGAISRTPLARRVVTIDRLTQLPPSSTLGPHPGDLSTVRGPRPRVFASITWSPALRPRTFPFLVFRNRHSRQKHEYVTFDSCKPNTRVEFGRGQPTARGGRHTE